MGVFGPIRLIYMYEFGGGMLRVNSWIRDYYRIPALRKMNPKNWQRVKAPQIVE